MPHYAIGLISGTSQDAIDGVLAAFDEQGRWQQLLASHAGQYPAELGARLLQLGFEQEHLSLREWASLDRAVAEAFADAALELLRLASVPAEQVEVIGSHGQTVFHDPDGVGSSLQLGDGGYIAIRTGIPTASDFRRQDIALGGQGAPLAPGFHHALFSRDDEPRAVLNLGGIANLSLLPNTNPASVIGFDTGPANALMDEWAQLHCGTRFDVDGAYGRSGKLQQPLLQVLLADAYFARPAPKSTGRGAFRLGWARARAPGLDALPPADVQHTFCELTARTVVEALRRAQPATRRLLVCGGGVRNGHLIERLHALLEGVPLDSTQAHGLHPDWVEAGLMAWLGMRRRLRLPGTLPAVTGASRAVVAGALYRP